jgi:hypothetical protein
MLWTYAPLETMVLLGWTYHGRSTRGGDLQVDRRQRSGSLLRPVRTRGREDCYRYEFGRQRRLATAFGKPRRAGCEEAGGERSLLQRVRDYCTGRAANLFRRRRHPCQSRSATGSSGGPYHHLASERQGAFRPGPNRDPIHFAESGTRNLRHCGNDSGSSDRRNSEQRHGELLRTPTVSPLAATPKTLIRRFRQSEIPLGR